MSMFPPPSGPSIDPDDPFSPVLTREDPTSPYRVEPPRRRGGWRAWMAGGIAGALLGGGVAFVTVKATEDNPKVVTPAAVTEATKAPTPTASNQSSQVTAGFDIQAVLANVSPSIVAIETSQVGLGGIYGAGAGSGIIISADGLVLTNNHVITGADSIKVKTSAGKEYDAAVIGADPSHDVAVVRMSGATGLKAATLGDTTTLKVGDTVVAIGNAFDLGATPTVTEGIVSAKGRSIETSTESLSNLIQTDAAINPGNSGGALVNAAGEVVGINAAGIQGAQNIGFAIDINSVKTVITQLEQGKGTGNGSGATTNSAAFLGISTVAVSDLTPAERQQLGVTADHGVVVTSVEPGAGAAQAGLRTGDVITAIDGKSVTTTDDVRNAISAKKPNDTLQVTYERNGQQQTVTARLGTRPVSTGG